MSAASLIFEIIGIDHASKEFEKVSKAMEKTSDRSKKLQIAGGIALAALAAGAVEFGKKSVDKFQEVGGATLALQRVMGGTATQASRLNFAAEETGVSSDQLGVSMKFLAKFMNGAQDAAYKQFTALDKTNGKLMQQKKALEALDKPSQTQKLRLRDITKELNANGDAQAKLGINTQVMGIKISDASGNMLPMNTVLAEAATLFSQMPNGAEKTAAAIKIFGRSGQALLPFLNKGAEGLKELGVESDKYGNTLTNKDTKSVYANIIAKRQLGAAVTGLQIQLGEKLLPVVTSVVSWFTRTVLWFSALSTTTKKIIGVIAALVGVIALVVEVTKVFTAVQTALNIVLDANPIGLIILGVAALAVALVLAYKKSQTFRDIVNGAFHAIQVVVSAVVGFIRDHWKLMLGIITGPIGLAITWIVTNWGTVKSLFSGAAKVFGKLLHGVEAAIEAPFKAAFAVIKAAFAPIQDIINTISNLGGSSNPTKGTTYSVPTPHGAARAFGGPVKAGIPYVVGEVRRELFVPDQDGTVVPSVPHMSSRGGDAQGSTPFIIQMDSRTVYQGLLTYKRKNGIVSLGLA